MIHSIRIRFLRPELWIETGINGRLIPTQKEPGIVGWMLHQGVRERQPVSRPGTSLPAGGIKPGLAAIVEISPEHRRPSTQTDLAF